MAHEPTNPFYLQDPYSDFLATEGVPVVDGFSIDCLSLPLEPWSRMGGRGAYIHLAGRGEYLSCYLAEIPPASKLEPEKHFHDEVIHVLEGTGATSVELPTGERRTIEWGPGSLFAVPLNAWHQHFNTSGTERVRFGAVTNLPIILNLFHNLDFIYDNPIVFPERFGEERYFSAEGELRIVKPGRHQWETNFVADLRSFKLQDWKERGAGGTSIQFVLADSTMHAHISEFGVGTYKKAHRHQAGAHIFCVTGHGYSLLWLDGQNPVDTVRVDWKPGTLYAPPDDLFHQHFNTASQPSRYLALGFGGVRHPVLESRRRGYEAMDKSVEEGGEQIEYEHEDPRILAMYEQELAEEGIESRMGAFAGAR
jgi:mannose-6-phosphate isomerase-like protein (cupin superfamily)